MSNPRDDADDLLRVIADHKASLEKAQQAAGQEIERVKTRHTAGISTCKQAVAVSEKTLEKLVKKHRVDILAGRDRADLAHGSVMLKKEKRVKKVKGMLARLKKAGLTMAVKAVKEVVDWDKVETFDNATLEQLKTHRMEKDCFSYELKSRSHPDG
jgi:hypothetical protein